MNQMGAPSQCYFYSQKVETVASDVKVVGVLRDIFEATPLASAGGRSLGGSGCFLGVTCMVQAAKAMTADERRLLAKSETNPWKLQGEQRLKIKSHFWTLDLQDLVAGRRRQLNWGKTFFFPCPSLCCSYEALFAGMGNRRREEDRYDGPGRCRWSNKACRRCQNRSGASRSHRRRFSARPRMNPRWEASAETSYCNSFCCSGKDTGEE